MWEFLKRGSQFREFGFRCLGSKVGGRSLSERVRCGFNSLWIQNFDLGLLSFLRYGFDVAFDWRRGGFWWDVLVDKCEFKSDDVQGESFWGGLKKKLTCDSKPSWISSEVIFFFCSASSLSISSFIFSWCSAICTTWYLRPFTNASPSLGSSLSIPSFFTSSQIVSIRESNISSYVFCSGAFVGGASGEGLFLKRSTREEK